MNLSKKAQGNLETLIMIGGAVLVGVVVVTLIISLGGQSRDDVSDQTDNISSSTDGPITPTITSVKANYLDCETVDVGGILKKRGLLFFSWKPISTDGTFKLIIENKDEGLLNQGEYVVSIDGDRIESSSLHPLKTNNLIVSDIDLGEGTCGDSYYLSIEVSKNNQSKTSSRYSFNWSDSGKKTEVISRPFFNPEPGAYDFSQFPLGVTLVSDVGNLVYYTTDGTDPLVSGTLYNGGLISITPNTTIKAISENNGVFSGLSTGTYTSLTSVVEPVTASPGSSSSLTDPVDVVLQNTTDGSSIYYTLDQTDPNCSGTGFQYSSSINIFSNNTIRAIACRDGYTPSSISVFNYSFLEDLNPVVLSPPQGDFNSDVFVNFLLNGVYPPYDVYYTLDGSEPSQDSNRYVGSAISITKNTTVKAIVFKEGFTPSPITEGNYTFTLNAPTFFPSPGFYSGSLRVTFNSVPGAKIIYTTDNSDPTFSNGITINSGESIILNDYTKLKTVAYLPGWSLSLVTEGFYGVSPNIIH